MSSDLSGESLDPAFEDTEASHTEPDSEKRRWMVVAGLIIALGVGIVFLLVVLRPEAEVVKQVARTPIVDGTLLKAQQGRFSVTASGRVQPAQQIRLQPLVSGQVVEVSSALKSGRSFAKGELLLRIDPATFQARVNELSAQLRSAIADLKLAEIQVKRTRQLVQAKATATEELDQREAAVLVAQARKQQIQASLERAQIDLNRTRIVAPFAGKVVSETVSVGDVVSPGNAIAELYSTDVFEVPVALSMSDAVLLENVFQETKLDTKAAPKATLIAELAGRRFAWPASIDRIEAGLDPSTRTVDVVLNVEQPNLPGQLISGGNLTHSGPPPLMPSMFVEAEIPTAVLDRYFKVPRDTLRADGSIWFVRIDDQQQGKVELAPATILSNQREWTYVDLPALGDGEYYALGTDIGSVVPGSVVKIRFVEPVKTADEIPVDSLDTTQSAPEEAPQ